MLLYSKNLNTKSYIENYYLPEHLFDFMKDLYNAELTQQPLLPPKNNRMNIKLKRRKIATLMY